MKRRILWGGLLLICVFALACQPPADYYGTETSLLITKSTALKAIPEYSARDMGRVSVGQRFELVRPVGEWYEVRLLNGQSGFVHSSVARVQHRESFILQKKLEFHADAKPGSYISFLAGAGTQVFTLGDTKNTMIYVWTSNLKGGWVQQEKFVSSIKKGHLPPKLSPSAIDPAASFGTWFVYEPFQITNEMGETHNLLPGQNVRKSEVSQRGYEIVLPSGASGWTPSARVVSVYGKPVVTTIGTDCYESLVGDSPVAFRYESGTTLMVVGYENGYYNVNAVGKAGGNTRNRNGKKKLRTGYVRGIGLNPIKFQLAVVAKEGARMRFEPQTSSAEVTRLYLGEEVVCLESRNQWWHIVTGGSNKDGWVKHEDVVLPEWGYGVALQDVDINLKGPGSQYRSPLHTLKRGDFVPLLQKWGDGYQVPVSEKEKLGWIQTQDVVTASYRPLIVTAEKIQIREFQKGGKRGRPLPRGTELIELRQEGAYHLVTSFAWEYGYVLAEDVAVMRYGDIYISRNDTIRFGPGMQYRPRPQTVYQREVSVIDYYKDWIQVDLGNNSGWIHMDINKLRFRK